MKGSQINFQDRPVRIVDELGWQLISSAEGEPPYALDVW